MTSKIPLFICTQNDGHTESTQPTLALYKQLGVKSIKFLLPREHMNISSRSHMIINHGDKKIEGWYDINHPCAYVAGYHILGPMLKSILLQCNNCSRIALIGDSTTAYCHQIKSENIKTLIDAAHTYLEDHKINKVNIHTYAYSGSSNDYSTSYCHYHQPYNGRYFYGRYGSFSHQLREIQHNISTGQTYDAILIIGGWNNEIGYTNRNIQITRSTRKSLIIRSIRMFMKLYNQIAPQLFIKQLDNEIKQYKQY